MLKWDGCALRIGEIGAPASASIAAESNSAFLAQLKHAVRKVGALVKVIWVLLGGG